MVLTAFVRASRLYDVERSERTDLARFQSVFHPAGVGVGATDAEVRRAVESVEEGGEQA